MAAVSTALCNRDSGSGVAVTGPWASFAAASRPLRSRATVRCFAVQASQRKRYWVRGFPQMMQLPLLSCFICHEYWREGIGTFPGGRIPRSPLFELILLEEHFGFGNPSGDGRTRPEVKFFRIAARNEGLNQAILADSHHNVG